MRLFKKKRTYCVSFRISNNLTSYSGSMLFKTKDKIDSLIDVTEKVEEMQKENYNYIQGEVVILNISRLT